MWKKKRVIIGVLAAVLLVSASIGGVALAQDNEENSQPKTLFARVADILGIEQQVVEDAFAQAQTEMRAEALDSWLQRMVDEGIMTEEEATRYKEWLEAKPDMDEYREKLKDWFEAKPDISGGFGFRSFGGFRGILGGPHGRGGICIEIH